MSQGCPPFVHLTITGGAIGCGPPLALGAALAAQAQAAAAEVAATGAGAGAGARPAAAAGAAAGRRVINLQADGSAMYTLQVTRFRVGD